MLLAPFVVVPKGQLVFKWVESCLRGSDILILKGCFILYTQRAGSWLNVEGDKGLLS